MNKLLLDAAIRRAYESERARRYGDGPSVLHSLGALFGQTPQAGPKRQLNRRRRVLHRRGAHKFHEPISTRVARRVARNIESGRLDLADFPETARTLAARHELLP